MNLTAAATAVLAEAATTEGHGIEPHITTGELYLIIATFALTAVTLATAIVTYMLWKVTARTLAHETDKAAEVATASIETAGDVANNAIDSIEHVAITRSAPVPPTYKGARGTKVTRRYARH